MDTKENTDRVFWTPVQHALWEPETAPLKTDPQWLAALAIDLRDAITEENFEGAVTYILRPGFPEVVAHVIVLDAACKNPRLTEHPAFARWAKSLKVDDFAGKKGILQ
jgi:hypothetical protein